MGSRGCVRGRARFSLLVLLGLGLRAEGGVGGGGRLAGLRMWWSLLAMYLPILEKLWLSMRISDILFFYYRLSAFSISMEGHPTALNSMPT